MGIGLFAYAELDYRTHVKPFCFVGRIIFRGKGNR